MVFKIVSVCSFADWLFCNIFVDDKCETFVTRKYCIQL